MSGSAAGDNTPPSGPPDLPAVLSFQEQQEVCPPLPMYPTFPPPHARATKPEILELCSRFPRVCRLELCSPVYLTPEDILRGYFGWSLAPPYTSYLTWDSWSSAPDSRRHIGWSLAPPMSLLRGELAQVAPESPLERSGRRAGAKRPDVHFGQKPACHHPEEPRAGPADHPRVPFGRASAP